MPNSLIPGIDYIGVTTPFYCIDEKKRLLLHKRSKNCRDEHGAWDAGGGELEFGESPDDGVIREIKEEYGCRAIIVERIPAISVIRMQKGIKTHWLALPFIVKVKSKEVRNNEPEKIDEIGWFTLGTFPSPLHTALEKEIINNERIRYLKKYMG